MQPVLYSTQNGPPGWIRRGTNVCYFRNNYLRHYEPRQTTYYTLTFTIVFPLREETCYIAYHFPYSYSTLKVCYRLYFSSKSIISLGSPASSTETQCRGFGRDTVSPSDLVFDTFRKFMRSFDDNSPRRYQYIYKHKCIYLYTKLF